MDESSRQKRESMPSRPPDAGVALLSLGCARPAAPGHHRVHKDGPRRTWLSPFWRIFGGTLLSIVALVIITLAQQLASILMEVRQDLNRVYKSLGELARQEEVDAVRNDVEATASGMAALRERSLLLEQELRSAEEERKQLVRELRELREWRAEVAGRRATLSPPAMLGEPRAIR